MMENYGFTNLSNEINNLNSSMIIAKFKENDDSLISDIISGKYGERWIYY